MKLKRVVMLTILILAIIGTTSYGTGIDFSPIEMLQIASTNGRIDPDDFKPSDIQTWKESSAIEIGSRIVGGIMLVGTIVAVGTIMVVGIKYMISSVEEKAEYKKTMGNYLIGAFLTFATCTLINIIYNVVTSINV